MDALKKFYADTARPSNYTRTLTAQIVLAADLLLNSPASLDPIARFIEFLPGEDDAAATPLLRALREFCQRLLVTGGTEHTRQILRDVIRNLRNTVWSRDYTAKISGLIDRLEQINSVRMQAVEISKASWIETDMKIVYIEKLHVAANLLGLSLSHSRDPAIQVSLQKHDDMFNALIRSLQNISPV
jgi:hypothetical protein